MNHARTSPFATAASPKDRPPCPIIHSLLDCITPTMDSLWTERSYHSSGMSAVSVSPCIIFIYLPCNLFLYPESLYACPYRDASKKCQPTNGFLPGSKVPGPTQDFFFSTVKLQISLHRTAFVGLNISQQYDIQVLNSKGDGLF